mmetsp:Transcript_48679/g.105544  ORF Transcript_48679/g.105544 Transcript_48679/m.105544 type:complete len:258 (-) Transcript_48679:24-797(-)
MNRRTLNGQASDDSSAADPGASRSLADVGAREAFKEFQMHQEELKIMRNDRAVPKQEPSEPHRRICGTSPRRCHPSSRAEGSSSSSCSTTPPILPSPLPTILTLCLKKHAAFLPLGRPHSSQQSLSQSIMRFMPLFSPLSQRGLLQAGANSRRARPARAGTQRGGSVSRAKRTGPDLALDLEAGLLNCLLDGHRVVVFAGDGDFVCRLELGLDFCDAGHLFDHVLNGAGAATAAHASHGQHQGRHRPPSLRSGHGKG